MMATFLPWMISGFAVLFVVDGDGHGFGSFLLLPYCYGVAWCAGGLHAFALRDMATLPVRMISLMP